MAMSARLGVLALALAISGCSHWPSAEHREVTLDSIQGLIDGRRPHAARTEPHTPPPAKEQCQIKVQEQLHAQHELLERLTKQIHLLSNANPTFTHSMCPPATSAANEYQDKMVVGSVEWVYLPTPGKHYKARVDSGATTSSIHALNIERFERNGSKWVRFELQDDEREKNRMVEAPLVRIASVKQASSVDPILRPVVKLAIALGAEVHESEFTLTDRSQMEFTVLLGRTFLQDLALIDVARTMVQPKYQPVETPPIESQSKESQPKEPQLKEPAADVGAPDA